MDATGGKRFRPALFTLHLLDLFDAALHASAAGELDDARLSLGVDSAALSETLTVEERKTGMDSFSLPLQHAALGHRAVWGWNMAIRRNVWEQVRGDVHRYEPETHDDMDLAFALGPRWRVTYDLTLVAGCRRGRCAGGARSGVASAGRSGPSG